MFLSISVKNQPILIFFAYNNILRKVCSEQRNITNLYVHLNCKVLPPHYLGKWEKGDFSKIFTYNRLNKLIFQTFHTNHHLKTVASTAFEASTSVKCCF